MELNQDCINKIKAMASDNTGQSFCDLFTAIANDSEVQNKPSATLVLPLYDEGSNLRGGDWAPELHFVIRKVASE